MNTQLQSGYFALLLAAAILLPALLATPAWAARGSTSIEWTPSTWESSGSGLKLPQERLDTGTRSSPKPATAFHRTRACPIRAGTNSSVFNSNLQEADMDQTTLLIIILLIVLIFGGGWYGRGRWF